jgi:epoxyqueuosine reductase QueG
MDEPLAEIKKLLVDNEFPIFGTAESASMDDAPKGHRPSDVLPDAKSVLAMGLPVPKGAYLCKGKSVETVWRTHNLYYKNIDAILLRISLLIEEQDETAVPIFGCFPFSVKGKGDLWGFASLVKMAEAAGLGTIGGNGLLFNSTYGPRLILGGVVTTASLPVLTWPIPDEGECPEGCHICQQKCPQNAIDHEGNVDRIACVKHSSKTPIFSHLAKDGEYQPEELERLSLISGADDNNMNTCIECVSECPYCS